MMSHKRVWGVIGLLVLLACAGGAWGEASEETGEREAAAHAERVELPAAAAYAVAPGDVLSVALTLKPLTKSGDHASQPIEPGDQLAVTYHFAVPSVGKGYRLESGDKVYLNFRYSPELSQLYTQQQEDRLASLSKAYVVQPDGTLVLTGLNEPLAVVGKTTGEVQKLVEAKYKGMLKVPDVGVSVEPQFLHDKSLMALVQPMNFSPILTVRVPPDGRLSLPLLTGLTVAGKTIPQVSRELTEHYRKLDYSRVTVNVWFEQVADARNRQLQEALGARQGPLSCEVLPEGRISLPLIPQYAAVGKSLAEIGRELTGQYRQQGMDRVQVAVWLEKPRGRSVRVLGEVEAPGVYPLNGSAADLWGVIAQAGGFKAEADLAAVRVMGGREKGAQGTFSFEKFLAAGEGAANPRLGGDELIFVPKKAK